MTFTRWSFPIVALVCFALKGAAQEADQKVQTALRQIHAALLEDRIDTKGFEKDLPLSKFLAALQKDVPKGQAISFSIDKDAFGSKFAEIAAMPMVSPTASPRTSLASIFSASFARSKIKLDYRVEPRGVTITTPERAVFTMVHDIRHLTSKPEAVGVNGPTFRDADDATRASLLTQRIVSALALPKPVVPESIEVLNGARFSIHTVGTRQAEFTQALHLFERLADLTIHAKTWLYEVDAAFYAQLTKGPRLSAEEAERRFFAGQGDSPLFKLLPKQKLIQSGENVLIASGKTATLLARQQIHQCSPSPEQILRRQDAPQVFVTGVAFTSTLSVSPNRRFVRANLTEKAATLDMIEKRNIILERARTNIKPGKQDDSPFVDVTAEVPLLKETTQVRHLDLPDGGSLIVPVQHRPKSLQDANRWWVLVITTRIIIDEEERMIPRDDVK